jgi:hypothetical protein
VIDLAIWCLFIAACLVYLRGCRCGACDKCSRRADADSIASYQALRSAGPRPLPGGSRHRRLLAPGRRLVAGRHDFN